MLSWVEEDKTYLAGKCFGRFLEKALKIHSSQITSKITCFPNHYFYVVNNVIDDIEVMGGKTYYYIIITLNAFVLGKESHEYLPQK